MQQLKYQFKQVEFLEDALNHSSFRGYKNNERLEFLGDAILNFVIASTLFRQNPKAREGQLTRFRSHLVCGATLVELAQKFNLGHYLRLGFGELKTGGAQRESILADALEAIVGAIYLDGGIDACTRCILEWYEHRLTVPDVFPDFKDPKTRLQEYAQANKLPLPKYTVIEISGAAHQQTFTVTCTLHDSTTQGIGTSRRRAEQVCAQKMLAHLNLTQPDA